MRKIAIFASGSGTNAENLIKYFSTVKGAEVGLVLSNKADSYVLERARKLSVESVIFDRKEFYNSNRVSELLEKHSIDFIVLAGFLWLVPSSLIEKYRDRIVNIHPALLPSYGGKGMYGDRVHKAVIENNEAESGITIHYVSEAYDEGNIIFQAKCPVESDDTPDSLAVKIHKLEYKHFPEVIHDLLGKLE